VESVARPLASPPLIDHCLNCISGARRIETGTPMEVWARNHLIGREMTSELLEIESQFWWPEKPRTEELIR
jgi:hypothetical protein